MNSKIKLLSVQNDRIMKQTVLTVHEYRVLFLKSYEFHRKWSQFLLEIIPLDYT
jgi:hypothetical protein